MSDPRRSGLRHYLIIAPLALLALFVAVLLIGAKIQEARMTPEERAAEQSRRDRRQLREEIVVQLRAEQKEFQARDNAERARRQAEEAAQQAAEDAEIRHQREQWEKGRARVTALLKAPSTATWPEWWANEIEAGFWSVGGIVEAKNPFNVQLRERWEVILDRNGWPHYSRIGDQRSGDRQEVLNTIREIAQVQNSSR